MGSTQSDIYAEKLAAQGRTAKRLLTSNLKDIDEATALAIIDDFRLIHLDLDEIPMTRKQRDQIDLKLKTLGLLLEQQ